MLNELLSHSVYLGGALSVLAYWVGMVCQRRCHHPLVNPLLIAVSLTIGCLVLFGIDYGTYLSGAGFLSWLLTPATVCLAIPLYEQLALLRKHVWAILGGVFSGVVFSLGSVLGFSYLFGFDHHLYVTLLPKSITTAMGIGVAEELGGDVSLTVAAIVFTGVFGNMIAEYVCRSVVED